MKISIIFFIVFSIVSFCLGQETRDNLNKNQKKAEINPSKIQEKKKQINDFKNKKSISKSDKNESDKKPDVDLKKRNQVVKPIKVENKKSDKVEENKKFGSSTDSGTEIKMAETKKQNYISNEELKEKLKNPKKIKTEK